MARLPKKRPRLKGVEVKPGSVRQARAEAGLSLAQVAGSELTRAAIHLVERGASRPSMPTLQLIATRTGKPLSYFLSERPGAIPKQTGLVDPRLTELEHLLVTGELSEAVDLANSVLKLPLDAPSEAQARSLLGQALVRLSRPDEAMEHLKRAKQLFEQLGDRWGYVDCLDCEAFGLYLLEDPRAVPTAEEALSECSRLEPQAPSLEVRILTHLGNMYVLRREWSKAIRSFDSAVEAAGALRDIGRLGAMYTSLSVAYQETGNLAKAASYAQRALAVHEMQRDRGNLARAQNNLGLVLMKQGDYARAAEHLESSLGNFTAVNLEHGRAHVLLSIGELHLNRGDLGQAEASFEAAAELSERLGERLTLALSHQFLGRVAAERGNDEETDAQFWLALELLSTEPASERLVECHAAYAQALEDRGDTRTANQHWKEALAASRPGLVKPISLDSELIARAN